MRKQINIYTLLTVLLLNLTACAAPKANIIVKVINAETGNIVQGAKVDVKYSTSRAKSPGMGWGTATKRNPKVGNTDKEGIYSSVGNTDKSPRIYVDCEGYYQSRATYGKYVGEGGYLKVDPNKAFKINKLLNRWEPYPCELTVKLRPIKNPVTKFYGYTTTYHQSPTGKKPIGFDMLKADWVKPYGKGEVSDFTLSMVDEKKVDDNNFRDLSNLEFQTEYDGIKPIPDIKDCQSVFGWPYVAPTTGYKSLKLYINREKINGSPRLQRRGGNVGKQHSVVRIRTKVDSQGNVISAYYGVITNLHFNSLKNTISISYKINAENKSRSLEFPQYPDENNNLIKLGK